MLDLADLILDLGPCEGCGGDVPGQPARDPLRCGACKRLDRLRHAPVKPGSPMTACKTCGRRVKLRGIADHMRDVHSAGQTQAKSA